LIDPLDSDDTRAAVQVLEQIGVKIFREEGVWQVRGGGFQPPREDLYCGDSAATLRFMTAVCSTVPGKCRLTAGPSLSKRPVRTLVEALKQWGVKADCRGDYAPVEVRGGRLPGGLTELPGDISSQYVSALLIAAPLAEQESRVRLTTPPESGPYILMTLECLRQFGISVRVTDDLREYVIPPQKYSPAVYEVEGDWSSASYLLALGAAAGEMKVSHLNLKSLQGDKKIVDWLQMMGASIGTGGDSLTVKKDRLRAIRADLNDCIDLLPTMAVMAALAGGTSELTGIRRARLKESDRISSMKEGLERAGIEVREGTDSLLITGGEPRRAVIDSKNDHRIAMAFSLLGAAKGGITLEGAECVSKTYPGYWDTLRRQGVKIDEQ
jgi:3-phosphoshikimate 1-carboxyvinyltransferase